LFSPPIAPLSLPPCPCPCLHRRRFPPTDSAATLHHLAWLYRVLAGFDFPPFCLNHFHATQLFAAARPTIKHLTGVGSLRPLPGLADPSRSSGVAPRSSSTQPPTALTTDPCFHHWFPISSGEPPSDPSFASNQSASPPSCSSHRPHQPRCRAPLDSAAHRRQPPWVTLYSPPSVLTEGHQPS
jgi:hypothetical protein